MHASELQQMTCPVANYSLERLSQRVALSGAVKCKAAETHKQVALSSQLRGTLHDIKEKEKNWKVRNWKVQYAQL
jgi:hypothetical protein